jgi:hypothetical protein
LLLEKLRELLIQDKPELDGPSGRSSSIELAISLPPECLELVAKKCGYGRSKIDY